MLCSELNNVESGHSCYAILLRVCCYVFIMNLPVFMHRLAWGGVSQVHEVLPRPSRPATASASRRTPCSARRPAAGQHALGCSCRISSRGIRKSSSLPVCTRNLGTNLESPFLLLRSLLLRPLLLRFYSHFATGADKQVDPFDRGRYAALCRPGLAIL